MAVVSWGTEEDTEWRSDALGLRPEPLLSVTTCISGIPFSLVDHWTFRHGLVQNLIQHPNPGELP